MVALTTSFDVELNAPKDFRLPKDLPPLVATPFKQFNVETFGLDSDQLGIFGFNLRAKISRLLKYNVPRFADSPPLSRPLPPPVRQREVIHPVHDKDENRIPECIDILQSIFNFEKDATKERPTGLRLIAGDLLTIPVDALR
jgi:hypothetical protein